MGIEAIAATGVIHEIDFFIGLALRMGKIGIARTVIHIGGIDIVPFGYADTLRGQAEAEENEAFE